MNEAAEMIQRNYKWWRFLQIAPRIRKAKQNKAAFLIQKYLKGYLCDKHVRKELSDIKIKNTYEYFEHIRLQY